MNTQTCTKCHKNKQTELFRWHKDTQKHAKTCKTCQQNKSSKWQKQNKNKINTQKRNRIKIRREWIDKLKSKPCADCKQTFPPECMDFDHTTKDKVKQISYMITHTKEKILEEIKKCELVCANCHRTRTKIRNNNK